MTYVIQFPALPAAVNTMANKRYANQKARGEWRRAKSKIGNYSRVKLRSQGLHQPIAGSVALMIDFYQKKSRGAYRDIDACVKNLLDALQGVAYEDDRQVITILVNNHIRTDRGTDTPITQNRTRVVIFQTDSRPEDCLLLFTHWAAWGDGDGN